jgi:hypothetical protein
MLGRDWYIFLGTSVVAVAAFLGTGAPGTDLHDLGIAAVISVSAMGLLVAYQYSRMSLSTAGACAILWLLGTTGCYLSIWFGGSSAGAIGRLARVDMLALLTVTFGDWLRVHRRGPTNKWRATVCVGVTSYLLLFNVLRLGVPWPLVDTILQPVVVMGALMIAMNYWSAVAGRPTRWFSVGAPTK